jgi:translation initiation factor 4A
MENTKLVMNSFEESFMPDPVEGAEETKPMSLPNSLLRGIYGVGFEQPTQVQKSAIVPLAIGRDAIIQAQSGMGKTGAFAIGALSRVDWSLPYVQVLILAPTMLLVKQTGQVVRDIGRYCPPQADQEKDWCLVCYGGGRSVDQESKIIKSGVTKVVIGTPGRVSHLMRERAFGNELKIIVFDEADSLLEERFLKEIQDIISRIPRSIQIAMFSATMSEESTNSARKLVRNDPPYVEVLLEDDKVSLEGISQYKIDLDSGNLDIDQVKLDVLNDLYRQLSVSRCIIFANTRKRAEWVGQQLKQQNHEVSILHGDLSKEERIYVEKQFRSAATRILVSSDILSRGFDVQDLSLVINFDMPTGNMALETYIHRVGRTGRYGRKGLAISLVRQKFPAESQLIETINKTYGGRITDLPANVEEIFKGLLGV